jgi:hypothetical protein
MPMIASDQNGWIQAHVLRSLKMERSSSTDEVLAVDRGDPPDHVQDARQHDP